MKIHIFGASGSGVTTLGRALADELCYPYFDNDQYFWEATDEPFTVKRRPELRNALLLNDLSKHSDWILGGSMVHWGGPFAELFDLAVFLLIPPEVRMARLKKREYERYGDLLFTDHEKNRKYEAFINWASGYDDNTTISQDGKGLGRTLRVHQDWIAALPCRFLQINGDTTVAERIALIKQAAELI